MKDLSPSCAGMSGGLLGQKIVQCGLVQHIEESRKRTRQKVTQTAHIGQYAGLPVFWLAGFHGEHVRLHHAHDVAYDDLMRHAWQFQPPCPAPAGIDNPVGRKPVDHLDEVIMGNAMIFGNLMHGNAPTRVLSQIDQNTDGVVGMKGQTHGIWALAPCLVKPACMMQQQTVGQGDDVRDMVFLLLHGVGQFPHVIIKKTAAVLIATGKYGLSIIYLNLMEP